MNNSINRFNFRKALCRVAINNSRADDTTPFLSTSFFILILSDIPPGLTFVSACPVNFFKTPIKTCQWLHSSSRASASSQIFLQTHLSSDFPHRSLTSSSSRSHSTSYNHVLLSLPRSQQPPGSPSRTFLRGVPGSERKIRQIHRSYAHFTTPTTPAFPQWRHLYACLNAHCALSFHTDPYIHLKICLQPYLPVSVNPQLNHSAPYITMGRNIDPKSLAFRSHDNIANSTKSRSAKYAQFPDTIPHLILVW